ncbi:non-ribosomal peptide synthetase [Mycobacterium asiaticum]|uniref:Non-ribosomal peptide synthetase n=1 Tax=Mycobacterium asiaticum TaxID=1790 RepID=A0A1A3N7Q8_MYCAS|nr:non-ribosomal peptide synthetase [Mycobacterium asiaticum]OBK18183.1 non-ribosomal peptide synthetase [Mycobacterium asiaticum]
MTAAPPQIEDVLALSPLQEGLFALYRLAEDSLDIYTMQLVADIDGPLNVALLRRSAQAMLDRHPNLRAAFWDRDVPRPVQIVPAYAELPWSERVTTASEFDSIARSERRRPFDLSRGPALRVVLLSVPGETRRRMIFTAHHILVDGWGLGIFFTEMLAVYQAGGSTDGLPAPRPYRDYIAWLSRQDRTVATAKWTDYLQRVSAPLIVADGIPTAAHGVPEKANLLLCAGDTARLRQWAGRNGLTLNTAVLFAWIVVLSRLTDRRDVVFGTVVSGRPEHLPGVETMVGMFINTVPVVHHLSGADAVVEQCRRLQRESSSLRDVGYLSLSELQRAHGHGSLFDTLFVFENAPLEDAVRPVTTADGTRFTPVEGESLTHYPLTVVSHLIEDALIVVVEAIREALPHLSSAQLCERLVSVLRQLPDIENQGPDALDVLTAAERAELDELAAVSVPATEQSVWQSFERQVRATPDAVALTTGDGVRYTYAELHAEAARLACELAQQGVGPETVVALVLPRSISSVVAIMGVLAAGGAYLPVDVALPDARIDSLLRQSAPVLAITQTGQSERIGGRLPTLVLDDPAVAQRLRQHDPVAPAVRRHPEHSAYAIFTSGSTGEPKGVVGTNAALLSYFADHRDRVYRPAVTRLGRPLRIAHAWAFSFDASWQPLVGLLDGHGVHLFDADEMRDADRLVRGLADFGVDMIDTTPSMFVQLRAAGLAERKLSVLALGGEAINATMWRQLRALAPTAVHNCYGPTETTVEAVVAEVNEYLAPTIGTVNSGTFGYVLDSELRVVPHGVVGELYLSGAQLARGYVGQPALTAARFVADPFQPGRRMYRTGDLVRRLPHGGYAYLGREDDQVKIRGYRVEIGEIESALRNQPEVHDAAVSVLRRESGPVLVGFVVWQQGSESDPVRLRAALTEHLPSYMVPARIVALPRLPVNANGKLDGAVLDELAQDALTSVTASGAAASTETERVLCEIFAEQFSGVMPHVDDDFFSLGLDSISAISVVHKAQRRDIPLTPRMVLSCPTVRQLAAAVDAWNDADSAATFADYGEVLPLPIVSWVNEFGNYRRFTNTILMRVPAGIERAVIELILQLLLDGHEVLRSTLTETPDGARLVTRPPGVVSAAELLSEVKVPTGTALATVIPDAARTVMDEIDPHAGAMVRAVWFTGAGADVLLLTIHHLVVDVVSWHILVSDIQEAWRSLQAGETPRVLPEFTSYRRWCRLIWERAGLPEVLAQRDYWLAQVRDADPALGTRHPDPSRDTWSQLQVTTVYTPVEITERLQAALTREDRMRAILLCAATIAIGNYRRVAGHDPSSGALIALDNHGRADAVLDTDTANTVGWFTNTFPVRLGVGTGTDTMDIDRLEANPAAARALLDSVTTHLDEVPHEGLDYGLLRYIARIPGLQGAAEPQLLFNYMGRLDLSGTTNEPWSLLSGAEIETLPVDPEPELPLRFALNMSVLIGATPAGWVLINNLLWSDALFGSADIDRLTEHWQRAIAVLAAALDQNPEAD